LSQAGAYLNNGILQTPEQIEMVYWFANFPGTSLRFPYSAEKKEEDLADFRTLVEDIQNLGENNAPLTDNEKFCSYCVYRSLCKRGVKAGPLDEYEDFDVQDNTEFEIDFNQISEIAF